MAGEKGRRGTLKGKAPRVRYAAAMPLFMFRPRNNKTGITVYEYPCRYQPFACAESKTFCSGCRYQPGPSGCGKAARCAGEQL